MDFLYKIRKQLGSISVQDDIQKYCTRTYSKINDFRNKKQLCDVILKVDGYEFHAHRIVLAASSDYFSAMFSCGMSESEQSVIELKSISLDIINEILEYIYTGNVRVTNENVQELLPAANMTQLVGLKRSCCIFLMQQIDATNVLGIRRFSEIHDCPILERFARIYAAHNMEAVLQHSEEFVQLSRSELRQLIKMSDLNVYSEESVYKAILKWIYFSKTTRIKWLPHLLKKVRLSQLSIRFLTDVVSNEPLIRQSLECRDLIDEAKLYHLRPDVRANLMKQSVNERFWARSEASSNNYMVLVGGFGADQAPISSVEIFDPRTLKWGSLPSLPGRYRYVAACSLASCIYVIGGFDGRERLNTVSVLDIGNQVQGWCELAPMNYKRGLAAACVYNGKIYVCGGFDGIARLKSLEVFNPSGNVWLRKTSMDTSREGAGLVVVDSYLYCIGGYNGMQLLDTVERYNIENDSWQRSEPMHYRRSGAGCAVMHETIYVCGGYGGATRQGPQHLDSVECYNTLTEQWSFITNMQAPRCYIGACQMSGMIWVAAGYDGNRLLNTVEAYDKYGLLQSKSLLFSTQSIVATTEISSSSSSSGGAAPAAAGSISLSSTTTTSNTWTTLKSCPMRHERCDTGMCIVRLFQLAEPLHSSPNNQRLSHSRSGLLQHHQHTTLSNSPSPAINSAHQPTPFVLDSPSTEIRSSNNYHFSSSAQQHHLQQQQQQHQLFFPPSAASYNSQSGQPVPNQHVTNTTPAYQRREFSLVHSLMMDSTSSNTGPINAASNIIPVTTANNNITYPLSFEDGGATEEVEGRGGPQLNIIGGGQISPLLTQDGILSNGIEVPGSVQAGLEERPLSYRRTTSSINTNLGSAVALPQAQAAPTQPSFFSSTSSDLSPHTTRVHYNHQIIDDVNFPASLSIPSIIESPTSSSTTTLINSTQTTTSTTATTTNIQNSTMIRPVSLSSASLLQHNATNNQHYLHQQQIQSHADFLSHFDQQDPLVYLEHVLSSDQYGGSSGSLSSIEDDIKQGTEYQKSKNCYDNYESNNNNNNNNSLNDDTSNLLTSSASSRLLLNTSMPFLLESVTPTSTTTTPVQLASSEPTITTPTITSVDFETTDVYQENEHAENR